MKTIFLFLALSVGLFAQSTKVGGSGSSKVGGSGSTKVTAYTSAAYNPATDPIVVQWVKADGAVYVSGTTQAVNGEDATTWVANTGQNLIQNTGANKLVFVSPSSAPSGLPAIVDDGSGSAKWMTSSSFGTLTQPYTVWIVMKTITTSGFPIFFDGISASDRAVFNGASGQYNMYAGTDGTTGTQDTNWHIFCLKYNGASSSITIDGGAPTTLSVGTNSFVGMTLNTLFDNSLRGSGQYGEIIVQNALPGNQAGTLAYLRARWATY